MATAKGSFHVSMTPVTNSGAEAADGVAHWLLDKVYGGDLTGQGRGQMLAYSTDVEGSAGYVAVEVVDGNMSGRQGRFVLQHFGIMNRNDLFLRVAVVPDSATGELAGLSGELDIDVVDGEHHYRLEYELPPL